MPRTRLGTVFVTIMVIVVSVVAAVVLTAAQATAPVFKPAQRVCVLCDFGLRVQDPNQPQQGLMADGKDGYIYATSNGGGQSTLVANQGTIYRFSPTTGKVDVLYSFDQLDHGMNPMGGLTRANDGTFYGTTYQGGRFHFDVNGKDAMHSGIGVVYRFKADPAFKAGGQIVPDILHVFRNGDMAGMKQTHCKDVPVKHCFWTPQQRLNAAASFPMSPPVQASNGSIYGVAAKALSFNYGILYKVEPSSDGLGIKALCIGGPMFGDDEEPMDAQLIERCMFNGESGGMPASLTADPKGDLYGITLNSAKAPNGTVFKATLDGRVTTLKNFKNPYDGSQPNGVIVGSDGKLYGTTLRGGITSASSQAGAGVVYRISPTAGAFQSESGFEVLHRLNGTSEGGGPLSQLVEVKLSVYAKSPINTKLPQTTFMYGNASGFGEGNRGVIFRIDTANLASYEVAYAFPSVWQASGSNPFSTMIKWDDPKTNLPVLFGTTKGGGNANYGALFRLGGLDLPAVQQPIHQATFYATPKTMIVDKYFPVAGESLQVRVILRSDVNFVQLDDNGQPNDDVQGLDGFMIDVVNCRNPHIVQFISRDKFDVLRNQFVTGTYYLPDRGSLTNQSYAFSSGDQEGDRRWRTDALQGPPNPYYDENYGAAHIVYPYQIRMFDAPSFGLGAARPGVAPNYVEGTPERWRAVMRDVVICNCKAVAEARWTREVAVKFHPDTNTWQQDPPVYKDMSVVAASDTTLDWVNSQLQFDASGKQYPLIP